MAESPKRGKHFRGAEGASTQQPAGAHAAGQAASASRGAGQAAAAPGGGQQSSGGKRFAAPARPADSVGSTNTVQPVVPVMSSGAYQGTGFIGQDRRPQSRHRRTLSTVLIVMGVVLLLVAAGMFGYSQWQYHKQDEINNELASYVTVVDDTATDEEPAVPVVDWEGLKAVNDDVVGWIQIPGTQVNYPVYQGETNDSYLRTTATGEYSIGGQIFLDYENTAPGLVDAQTLIYGHHLNDGSMFATVDQFSSQETFDAYDTIWYVTEDATYELEPLLFYKTAATNAEARQMVFASAEDFHTYLGELLGEATASDADASAICAGATKVLTLATCDYENDFGYRNGRGMLVCALKSEADAIRSGTMTNGG